MCYITINVLCRCIDGFSRKIIWLKASYTNHKPGLIASFFLDAVEQYSGYPARVRTDCGTENGTIATIQSYVTGSTSSHIYGTSPGNQRIEAWWSFFRRNQSQFWINLFEDLIEFGSYDPNRPRQMDCLRFCFLSVVQRELDSVRVQWNTHRIRPSVGARCHAGIPDELYYLPPAPAVDCLVRDAADVRLAVAEQLEDARACEDTDLHIDRRFEYCER